MGGSASKPAQLTINCPVSQDCDVVLIPPIVLAILLLTSFVLGKYFDRYRFLPESITALTTRFALFGVAVAALAPTVVSSMRELSNAGSGAEFTPVGGLATTGMYAYSRNPLYSGLVFVALPMVGVLSDSAWPLIASAPMYVWISKMVIPAEEALLQKSFGAAYEAYAASTPRWVMM